MSAIQDGDELQRAEKGVPAVEEAAPPVSANDTGAKPSTTSRRKIWIGVAVLVILAIVVGLTVGLTVSSKRQKNDTSGLEGDDDNDEGEPPQPSSTPPPSTNASEPTGTTTNPPTDSPVEVSTDLPVTNTPTAVPPTPTVATTEPPVEEALFYQSTSGVFNVTLPLFSSSVALGYSDEDELERDLIEATKFKVNRAVAQPNYYYNHRPVDEDIAEDGEFADTAGALPPSGSPVAGDVDDFETNTVEDSIDEGDLLKTNGVHAFAAYGSYVIAWDVETGEEVGRITLPAIEYDGQKTPIEPYEVMDPDEIIDLGGGGGRKRRILQFIDEDFYYWPQEPSVRSLLLHGDRLVVIADGYGQSFRNELDYVPAFYDAFATNVRIYDISPLSTITASDELPIELPLVHEYNVHGNFNSIRSDENQVHLVTFASLDTWSYIDEPLARSQPIFFDLSDEEYEEAARQIAEETLIPNFVSRLLQDISTSGEPANIARISLWQKHLSTDSRQEESVFDQGVINYYGQVTSFDILDTSETLQVSEAGVFMPVGWGFTYATDKMLVVVGQGWDWIEEMGGSVQTTYLHGFELRGDGLATPAAIGSLDGSILNEYSVDVVDNYMRVAVTIRNDFWVFPETEGEPPTPRTENYIAVLKIPDIDDTASDDGAVMKVVGRSENLGEDGEVFTSVRFSNKVAYAVTFEQTDPFYVISFENETVPEVLGELKITGFASYLHFINDEDTLLLGVGQEADEEGRRLGLQVTLYDATIPTDPKNISRYPFELDEDTYSSSSAEFDYKAFRYVKLGDDFGILIIPIRIDSYTSTEGNFDGFALLDVSRENGISLRFNISHVDSADFRLGCYYWSTLAERSFVVDGDVTTLKGHSIRQWNLDSREQVYGIDLDVDRVPQDQCIYW